MDSQYHYLGIQLHSGKFSFLQVQGVYFYILDQASTDSWMNFNSVNDLKISSVAWASQYAQPGSGQVRASAPADGSDPPVLLVNENGKGQASFSSSGHCVCTMCGHFTR